MTDAAISEEVGNRIAAWLRQVYPRDGAKLASQDFKVSHHTTRRWFEGLRPNGEHFDLMVKRWGDLFFKFVYSPIAGQGGADVLTARIAFLQERMDRVEESLARGPFNHGAGIVVERRGAVGDRRGIGRGGEQTQPDAPAVTEAAEMKDAAE